MGIAIPKIGLKWTTKARTISAKRYDTVIGMLLGLDIGIISTYVNGEWRESRADIDLGGHYIWAVVLTPIPIGAVHKR